MKNLLIIIAFIGVISSSCTTVYDNRSYSGKSNSDKEFNLGKVQKEIRKGMSGAEVAELLGSPNIVTKDEKGMETWVYDRIATEANYSQNSSALFIVLYGQSSKNVNTEISQKTLTVVIKFDEQSKVNSFSYHSSKF